MTLYLDEGRAPVVIDSAFHATDPVPVTGTVSVSGITLEMSDIQIGAVEIKDATTTNRAVVSAAGELSVDTELPAAALLSDTIANPTTPIIAAGTLGLNPFTGVWERIRSVSASADHGINTGEPSLLTYAILTGSDGPTQARKIEADIPVDNLSITTTYGLNVNSFLMGFDGSAWDRIRTTGSTLESFTGIASGAVQVIANLYGYDDAFGTWERARLIRDTELDGIDNDSFNRSLITQSVIRGLNAGGDYDRIRGTVANGLEVDVTRIQGIVTVSGLSGSAGLTDAELRASPVPVSGPLTDAELRASVVPVDTELPTAALVADATADPTVPAVQSFPMVYNQADDEWDKTRGAELRADYSSSFEEVAPVSFSLVTGINGNLLRRIHAPSDFDALDLSTDFALSVAAGLRGLNSSGTDWDRLRADGNDVDAEATISLGVLQVNSNLKGFNETTWDRLRAGGNDADALVDATLGVLSVNSFMYGHNGATWDRLTVDGAKNLNVTLATSLDSSDDSVAIGSGVTVLRTSISVSGVSNELVAAVSGQQIKVLSMLLMVSGFVLARFESGGGADLSGDLPLDALGAGFVLPAPAATDGHWIETELGEALNLELSSAVHTAGFMTYYTE